MNKYINHIELSNQHLKKAVYYDSLNADQSLVAAQVEATLALVEQQRIANLIALANASAMSESYDDTEEARREASYSLIEYRLVDPDTEYPFIRSGIASALGIDGSAS